METLFKDLTQTYHKVRYCWGSQTNKQVSYYIILSIKEADVSCKYHILEGVQQADPSPTKLYYIHDFYTTYSHNLWICNIYIGNASLNHPIPKADVDIDIKIGAEALLMSWSMLCLLNLKGFPERY